MIVSSRATCASMQASSWFGLSGVPSASVRFPFGSQPIAMTISA